MAEHDYEEIGENVKRYIKLRYDLLRLQLLEKSSQIISLMLMIAVVAVLLLGALVYFSLSLVVLLEPLFGGLIWPLCLVGALYVIGAVLAVLFKKQWFLNPLVRMLSKILFKDPEDIPTLTNENDEE